MRTAGHRLPVFSFLFLCGVAAAQFLPALPDPLWSLTLLPTGYVVWRWRRTWPVAAVVLGVAWAVGRAAWVLADQVPPELVQQDVWLTGQVVSLPATRAGYRQFDLRARTLTHGDRTFPAPGRVRLRWYGDGPPIVAGQRWRLHVRLKPPHGYQNPGGFDYEGWLFRQRIRATGYVRANPGNRLLSQSTFWLDRWRQQLRADIQQLVPRAQSGLLTALAVGDRGRVTPPQWETLRRTGTAHLLAISGLHIGLAAALGMWLGSLVWRVSTRALLRCPAQQAGAVFGLLAAAAYAALAGFSIPTQRALIMVAVVMAGWIGRRQGHPIQTLAVALLGVLLWDPLAVLDAGFWLSFAAVGAIFWCLAFTHDRQQGSRWHRTGWRWLRVQWLLWLALAPLLLLFFGQFALTAPLANLLAVPVVAFTVVPLVLCGIGGWFLSLGAITDWAWQRAAEILAWLWPLLDALAGHRFSVWQVSPPAWWALAAALLGVLVLVLPRGMPGKSIGLLLCLPALFPTAEPVPAGAFTATVLDVGQGLSVVVRTRRHTLVYDTGARFRSGFDLGRAVLVPYLLGQARHRQGLVPGPVRVDTLVISHGDNDHIGGMRSLLSAVRVGRRLSSVPARVPGAEPCVAGQSWTWDGVRFSVLHPQNTMPAAHNNASCLIKISGAFGSLLLTGDIEAAAEEVLLAAGRTLASDVLLVPHQGSATSSTPAFIAAVAPRIAVVSAGYRNRYGHPHPRVADRYRRAAIPLYNTAQSGAVTIRFDRRGVSVDEQRRRARRYWFSS